MKDETKTGLLAHAGAYALLYLALMTPPSILSHKRLAITFVPAVLACDIYSWKMGLGFLGVVQGLLATELLLFRNPRQDFKLLHFETSKPEETPKAEQDGKVMKDGESKGKGDTKKDDSTLPWKEPYPSSLWKRFVWVTKLLQSLRYISWDTGYSSSPTHKPNITIPRASRTSWLLQKLLFITFCLLLQDATNLYMSYDPYFQIEGSIDEQLPRRLGTFLARYHLSFLPPRGMRMIILGSQQYAVFSLLGSLPAVVMVLLGWMGVVSEFWGRKENYPAWMGNPVVVFSEGLRGYWGKFWHQLLRQMFLGPGNALCTLLSLPPKSTSAAALRVFTAFIISGFLHGATLPLDIPGVSPLKYAMFFWVHVEFVLFEMAVEYVLRDRVRDIEKEVMGRAVVGLVRLIWVGCVFWWTMPMVVDQLVRVARVVGVAPVMFLPGIV